MPYSFNPFTGNFDWYQEGGTTVTTSAFVPYTGATSNVQLDYYSLSAYSLKLSNLSSDPYTAEGSLYYRTDTQRLTYWGTATGYAIANLNDLGAYVKYTGSTGNVGLGSYWLSASMIGGGALDTMVVNGASLSSQVQAHSDSLAVVEAHTHSNTAANGAAFYGARSRGDETTPLIVQNGDILGFYASVGFDGTDYATAGYMYFQVDGTPGANDMPCKWILAVSPDGTQTPVTAVTVTSGSTTFATSTYVPDEAYGAGWNGSLATPTKNAVYDKIESMVLGGGIGAISAAADGTFGSPAIGDVMYKTSGGYWTNLPIGTAGYVLTSQGTSAAPYWISSTGGSGTQSLLRSLLTIGM